jgi:hypothetical protein
MSVADEFAGCRAHPTPHAVEGAITIVRNAADQLAMIDFTKPLPTNFITTFNRAVVYLLWHQAFAMAARAIRSPYIPSQRVSRYSGLAVIRDKDSGSGYKARLVWLPRIVRDHMAQTEALVQAFRDQRPADERVEDAVFFLGDRMEEQVVTPTLIEEITAPFFPFPCNTPRRVMRSTLVRNSFSREMVDAFMGHWRERQEPWGKWSTFSYENYLSRLEVTITGILGELGFRLPERARGNVNRRAR